MIKFNLKKVMKQKNLNISQLNEMTGISRNSLSLLINGKSQGIQFETIEKITRALNIEIEDLFERSFNELKIEVNGIYNVKKTTEHIYNVVDWKTNEVIDPSKEEKDAHIYNYIGIKCKYVIDGSELEEVIPYNLSLEFNSNIKMHLNISLKNTELKNDFIFLFDNVYNSFNLFLTYITACILDNRQNKELKKIKNHFDVSSEIIEITNDLNTEILHFPLQENLTINFDYLKSEIEKSNQKSKYEIRFDDAILLKYLK